ncbi:hypothetical protein JI85_14335 [Listeria monocytogenes]|nr:hypothetical protein [Listeria monocytogenes]EAD0856245.1 hypothetical protein [Listeria monocytogenes]EAF2002557.1 hypothetical protein [Listeria monocytogenes]
MEKSEIKDYFLKTIYSPQSLMVETEEKDYFDFNPNRGIRNGNNIDLRNLTLGSFLKDVYGETMRTRISGDDINEYDFQRRNVASGGALYPNIIYVIQSNKTLTKIYQYNPALHTLIKIKDINGKIDVLEEDQMHFIITSYYWRNWMKYRYFGYRLIAVDTGYLISLMCAKLRDYKVNTFVQISSEKFRMLNKVLELDLEYESMYSIISCNKENFNLENIKKERVDSELTKDMDAFPLPFYKEIELAAIDEKFSFESRIEMSKVRKFNVDLSNRVSPGGAQLSTSKPLEKKILVMFTEKISTLLNQYNDFSQGIEIYIKVNNATDVKTGIYCIKGGKLEYLNNIGSDEKLNKKLLTKKISI